MDADLQQLLGFLDEQRAKQAPRFPTVRCEKVLSFMGTTSLPGSYASVAICPIAGLDPESTAGEMRVRLRGHLPRDPAPGECITVHVTNVEQYQGFQIKTRVLGSAESLGALVTRAGDDLTVHGVHTFTVHHSPYTMKFFEQIPFEEVQLIVGAVPYALVAVGETANVSPRFVFHTEVRDGRPVLFHGDGLALKTYMNLKSNRQETRTILDLDDFSGFQLRGTVEEFQPHQHPEAYQRICQGFTAGNWGKPSRTFRFVAESWQRVAPTGPSVRRRA